MLSDPQTFSKQELGKEPEEYVTWLISGSAAWGGIPELKALSLYFEIEIGVVVIQDVEILLFGGDKNYSKRIYVLYDGTHYNLIRSKNHKVFDPKDESVY